MLDFFKLVLISSLILLMVVYSESLSCDYYWANITERTLLYEELVMSYMDDTDQLRFACQSHGQVGFVNLVLSNQLYLIAGQNMKERKLTTKDTFNIFE